MIHNNPLNIPKNYALDIDATMWQKIYVHIALEKAGYRMFATTKSRFLVKKKDLYNKAPYTNLVKGSIIFHEGKICCHFSTNASTMKPFEWWYDKLLRVRRQKWSSDTYLDEQIKNLIK